MFRYLKLTYQISSLTIRYFLMDKNNQQSCDKFYDDFLKLGIIPTKIFQWIINYTYHLTNHENKSLLFEIFYHRIMDQCQIHDLAYSQKILRKYNLQINNLELIKSGSIGQVYKGEWNNKIVAVKIQHPEVNETTKYWFSFFKFAFFLIKITNNVKKLNLDWDSLKVYFKSQFDFREEGKNLKKFYQYYDENEYIIIPQPYFYEKDILIMEYIESQSLDLIEQNYSKYTYSKISNFMILIIEDMFENKPYLHGDFHGGNYGIIINSENTNKFKIVLYDFGVIIHNSIDLRLMYTSILYDCPELYLRSFSNIFNIENNLKDKFKDVMEPIILEHFKNQNVSFNDMLKTFIVNNGNIKISLESIFLITTFLNTEKFRKVIKINMIDKISMLEEFKCFPTFYENLVSYYFNDDKSFLEDDKIIKNFNILENKRE